jgi:hypothetical protein
VSFVIDPLQSFQDVFKIPTVAFAQFNRTRAIPTAARFILVPERGNLAPSQELQQQHACENQEHEIGPEPFQGSFEDA